MAITYSDATKADILVLERGDRVTLTFAKTPKGLRCVSRTTKQRGHDRVPCIPRNIFVSAREEARVAIKQRADEATNT